MNNKQTLLDILATIGATINFTKADGTVRIMRATRNFTSIPVSMYPVQDSLPAAADDNDNNIKVFDLDQCQWRSFNFDRLNGYTFIKDDQVMYTHNLTEGVTGATTLSLAAA